jgi:hypothetical protein
MTKRAVKRVIAISGAPLALWLSASCAMEGQDEQSADTQASDDEAGGSADEASAGADETPADEAPADEAGPEAVDETQQGLTNLLVEDFESEGSQLTSPWSWAPAAGETRAVVTSAAGHGNVMRLEGSEAYGQYMIAYLPLSTPAPSDVVASVDVNPDPGAAFVWSLYGQGSGTYKRRVRLQRWPGSTTLVATSVPTGDANCGPLPSGSWTNLTLVMHAQQTPHTFDVLINGEPTRCTGIEVVTNPPYNRVEIMDASNEGWGGNTEFDNIRAARP